MSLWIGGFLRGETRHQKQHIHTHGYLTADHQSVGLIRMASSPNKILLRLAGAYQNEFTKRQFRAFFFRSDYGYEKIEKHWSTMIREGYIEKSMSENGYQKTNDQSEPLFRSTIIL